MPERPATEPREAGAVPQEAGAVLQARRPAQRKSSGAGGAFDFDAGFDLDAFAGLLGNYTCADLAACCPTLAADQQSACTQVVSAKSDPICSGVLTGFKAQGLCK